MKTVIISVVGGVVSLVHKPKDVKLVVKDYDVEGIDREDLLIDDEGEEYVRIEFT